ncbi:hypothetical protein BH18ACT13_BH18ACT13_20940 [soil metagenome]
MRTYKCGLRLLGYAALPLAVASLTACGTDVEIELVWGGPPDPNSAGIVSTAGFASFQGNVDEHWERSAAMAAAEFLRLDERTAVRTSIDGKAAAEGIGPQTVTVTLDGLADDSIRAERWSLAFEPDGETYRLTTALREQRCQPNRGHQGFSADDCL